MNVSQTGLTPSVIRLLESNGLPVPTVHAPIQFIQLEMDDKLIACAGLEITGSSALLRSVAVNESVQNKGYGKAVTEEAIHFAAQKQVQSLWLLTTTAEHFFRKFGFVKADRKLAPESIRHTDEFKSVCPASAICMSLYLNQ